MPSKSGNRARGGQPAEGLAATLGSAAPRRGIDLATVLPTSELRPLRQGDEVQRFNELARRQEELAEAEADEQIRLVHDPAEIPREGPPPLVLNWGSTQALPGDLVTLNQPESVRVASDQVASLVRLRELAPRTVLNPQDIPFWVGSASWRSSVTEPAAAGRRCSRPALRIATTRTTTSISSSSPTAVSIASPSFPAASSPRT